MEEEPELVEDVVLIERLFGNMGYISVDVVSERLLKI